MAVIVNKNTQQTPISNPTGAVTGVQSIKFIPAGRVYIKSVVDSLTATPCNVYSAYTQKSNGATNYTAPVGAGVGAGLYNDLGIMLTPGKITYNKVMKRIQTGLDKITQLVYTESRTATFEFELTQLDDYVLQQMGFIASVITAGSSIQFQIGQEDVINVAMVVVYQNKLDGKEIQWYHPSAGLMVQFNQNGDELSVKVMAEFVAFQAAGATLLSLVSTTVFK